MGQVCQGELCINNHQNDKELPQMQDMTPLKINRLQSKKSLFVVDDEMRATVYEGNIDERIEEFVGAEEETQPHQLHLQNKMSEKVGSLQLIDTSPPKARRLKRAQTLAILRSKEDLQDQFFNLKLNAPIMEEKQEETDQFLDFLESIKLYQRIIREYEAHDLDTACDNIAHLQKLQESIRKERNLTLEEFDNKFKELEEGLLKQSNLSFVALNRELLAHIKALLADMNHYYDLAKRDPFEEKYDNGNIKISTRRDGNSMGVLIQTELKSPFENMAAFFNDIQYFPDFLPFCKKAYLVKDCGRNSKVGYAVLNFPVISKRQAFFQGSAYNRLDHTKEIVFYCRSIHDKPHLQEELGVEIVPNKKYVQMEFKFFVLTYQPLSKGVGKLKFAANFDYGINFLPNFVEQFAIKEFGKLLFDNMMQISENFKGSKWEQSIQKDPGVFLLVREMIDDYLSKKTTEV